MGQLASMWNQKLEKLTRDYETRERVARDRAALRSAPQLQSAHVPTNLQTEERVTLLTIDPVRETASTFTWKELESRFREFHTKLSGQKFTTTYIRTEWESGDVGEEWTLGGTPVWRKDFENLATIAARKLGYTADDDADVYWLNRVRGWMEEEALDKDRDAAWLPSGMSRHGESVGTMQDFQTERIGELSAMFCMELIGRGTPESTVSQPIVTPPVNGAVPSKRRPKKLTKAETHRRGVIFGAIQSNLEGLRYCKELDIRRLVIPSAWIDDGCPATYTAAYVADDPKWRQRIQDEKYRYSKKYAESSPTQREKLIQQAPHARVTRH